MEDKPSVMSRKSLAVFALLAFMTLVLGLLAWGVHKMAPPPVQLSPEEQAARDAHFNLIFPWLLGFTAIVGPLAFGSIFWLAKWSRKLPPEPLPTASYIFAATVCVVCAGLGVAHALNNDLNAFGVALMCGFGGLMLGGAVGSTFAAPRDAAKGAAVGLIIGAALSLLQGFVQWKFGKPLWDREAWEARGIMLPLIALVGALSGMWILRVKRYKRRLAGDHVDRLSS